MLNNEYKVTSITPDIGPEPPLPSNPESYGANDPARYPAEPDLSGNRGVDGFKETDFTTGTTSASTDTIELRVLDGEERRCDCT